MLARLNLESLEAGITKREALETLLFTPRLGSDMYNLLSDITDMWLLESLVEVATEDTSLTRSVSFLGSLIDFSILDWNPKSENLFRSPNTWPAAFLMVGRDMSLSISEVHTHRNTINSFFLDQFHDDRLELLRVSFRNVSRQTLLDSSIHLV